MRRGLLLGLLVLGMAACGTATPPPGTMPTAQRPEFEGPCTWMRLGAGFAAIIKRDHAKDVNADSLCQRMGSIYIGMPEAEARRFLPGPAEVVPNAPGGGVTFHHSMGTDGPDAFVKYDEGRLATFQLSGEAADRSLNFHSVHLGMPEASLAQRFGPPMQRYPASYGAVLWAYRPWPFSFLVREGRVVSIRFYRARDDSPERLSNSP